MATTKRRKNTGNIAIVVAVSLTVLIGMLALVVDGGNLYATRDKYQNGVEAAAMASALHLCDDDPIGVARVIAGENGLPFDSESLTVTKGFYDENNEYNDFTAYRDFVAEGAGDYPDGEYNNAVMVSLDADVSTFLAGIFAREQVSVKSGAVAYLKRYGIVSLNDEIYLWTGTYGDTVYLGFKNGDLYAHGDIKLRDVPTLGPPTLEDCKAYACGAILSCTGYSNDPWPPSGTNCSDVEVDEYIPGAAEITEIPPVDDEEMERLRDKANIIYTADSSKDEVFYWEDTFNPGSGQSLKHAYYFDITGEDQQGKKYFVDIEPGYHPDDGFLKVVLINNQGPVLCLHTPNGTDANALDFVSRLPIHMDAGAEDHYGGEDQDQVNFITPGYIWVHRQGLHLHGVYFRAGNYFTNFSSSSEMPEPKMRVITDGRITLYGDREIYDASFGPPCPPSIVKLGRLETAGD